MVSCSQVVTAVSKWSLVTACSSSFWLSSLTEQQKCIFNLSANGENCSVCVFDLWLIDECPSLLTDLHTDTQTSLQLLFLPTSLASAFICLTDCGGASPSLPSLLLFVSCLPHSLGLLQIWSTNWWIVLKHRSIHSKYVIQLILYRTNFNKMSDNAIQYKCCVVVSPFFKVSQRG